MERQSTQIMVSELPTWLQEIIRKKLQQRMSREHINQYMTGTLDAVSGIMEK